MALHTRFQPRTAISADALDRLDHVVVDFVDQLGNIGMLVALDVAGVGRMTFTAGHSDYERSREVAPGDIFQIGSQSKTITAMTLLSMARDGLLDLDSPVVGHVDLPIDRRITTRHLR